MQVKVIDRQFKVLAEQIAPLVQNYFGAVVVQTDKDATGKEVELVYHVQVSPKSHSVEIKNEQGYTVGRVVVWAVKDNCRVKVLYDDLESDLKDDSDEYWRKTIWQGQRSDRHRKGVFVGLARYLIATIQGESVAKAWQTQLEKKAGLPAKWRGKPGRPPLAEAELIPRLALAQQAEELKRANPEKTWGEIAYEIGWRFGSGKPGLALLRKARRRLAEVVEQDQQDILAKIADFRANETN
jgi:hypothetical protein